MALILQVGSAGAENAGSLCVTNYRKTVREIFGRKDPLMWGDLGGLAYRMRYHLQRCSRCIHTIYTNTANTERIESWVYEFVFLIQVKFWDLV